MTTSALLTALLAKRGKDYFGEFQAFMEALLAENAGILAAALGATTSASSHSVTTGSKVFVMADERPYGVGAFVLVARTSDPTTWLFGQVTARSTTSLTVDVAEVHGSGGPYTDWTVTASGPKGTTGETGPAGADGEDGVDGENTIGYVGVAGGTADALTGSATPKPAVTLQTGEEENTGPATYNGQAIQKNGAPLEAGDLPANTRILLVDTGEAWELVSSGGVVAAPVTSGGGLPDGVGTEYYALTTSKTSAIAAVGSGKQALVYGFTVANTHGTDALAFDLYFYDANTTTETQLLKGVEVPADRSLFVFSLEPMFVMDEGDEIRVNRGSSGTGHMAVQRAVWPGASTYEMKVGALTTSAVSQLAAVGSGVTKRVVSCLVGNVAASPAAHDLTAEVYDDSAETSFAVAKTMQIPQNQTLQLVVDGFGPTLEEADEWRMRASSASVLTHATVVKVA